MSYASVTVSEMDVENWWAADHLNVHSRRAMTLRAVESLWVCISGIKGWFDARQSISQVTAPPDCYQTLFFTFSFHNSLLFFQPPSTL